MLLSGKEFFQKAFEEGYDENVEQVQGDIPEVVVEPVAEVEVKPVIPEVEITPEEVPKVDKFNIDGEEITLEQIKEWKQNGLRQSDYTKKTQELAQQRKELEALKGDLPEQEEDLTELARIEKLERALIDKELDLEITSLKVKYPDFDEVAVLDECNKRNVYDLEFIYKALRTDIPVAQLDVEQLKTQAIEEYKAQIASQKQINKEAVAGSIVSSTPGSTAVDYGEELSHSEKEYCARRGWTHKEYVDMKNNTYKI